MIVAFHVYSENVDEIKNMNKSFFFTKGAKIHFSIKKKIVKCLKKNPHGRFSKTYSRTITPRVRMSVVNYFFNRSSSMCLWHKERHEQIPLNEEQKMTKGSFLNYQPGRLGNLANFQVESNLCNANQVHPSLCHNGESLGHRKAQVPLSQV